MSYLLACILVNVFLLVLFKRLNDYDVELFNVILVNYLVCVATGLAIVGPLSYVEELQQRPAWLPYCMGLGFCFISGFYLVGLSSQTQGVAPTSIAQRMSFIASILFGYFLFSESLSTLGIIGCVLGLVATVLIQAQPKSESGAPQKSLHLLLGVFILSSIIELVIFYLAKTGISPPGNYYSTITIFLSAGIIGFIWWLFRGKALSWRDWVGGVVLGIPNFFSIYFLFEALNSSYGGGQIISWINLGILVMAFIVGILFLGEKMNKWRSMGAMLAVLAIVLILVSG